MKKILTTLTFFLLTILLVSCTDNKTYNDDINVFFFTETNATKIPPLYNIEEGELIVEPEEPIRIGFSFVGWFKDATKTIPWNFSTDRVTKTTVLYPLWLPGFFPVYYELNGGSMPSSFKFLEDYPEEQRDPETNPELSKYLFFKVGQRMVLPQPTRAGYTFKNWYLYDEYQWEGAPEGTLESFKPGDHGYVSAPTEKSEPLYLYAHWVAKSMSVSFNTNYPVANVMTSGYYRSRTLTYGNDFVYDSNNTGEPGFNRIPDFLDFNHNNLTYDDLDYEFIGWNDKADGTGNWFGDGTGEPGELTWLSLEFLSRLYAQWKPKDA